MEREESLCEAMARLISPFVVHLKTLSMLAATESMSIARVSLEEEEVLFANHWAMEASLKCRN